MRWLRDRPVHGSGPLPTTPPPKAHPVYEKDAWRVKQELAAPSRFYGDGGTIHSTGHLDVEVDDNGVVVAVWYRCLTLPFVQHKSRGFADNPHSRITGVEIFGLD